MKLPKTNVRWNEKVNEKFCETSFFYLPNYFNDSRMRTLDADMGEIGNFLF